MLRSLSLKDFVIVDSMTLDFTQGFSVLTGETGAGKSILLDALALVTGARGDSGSVREGQSKADISAEFSISDDITTWLGERELSGDDGVLQLRRVVEADGRSKAFINGHPGTAAMLKELGEQLLDIHGQHAAQSLTRGEGQRELLDSFAAIQSDVKIVGQRYKLWNDAKANLAAANAQSATFAQERDRIQWQLNELSEIKLVAGEWESLNIEQKRLANAAQLIEIAQSAALAISDDDNAVVSTLQSLAQRLKALVALDPSLQASLELIDSAIISLDEAGSDLSNYAQKIELDPQRLEQIDNRIGQLFSASRKFKVTPDALTDHEQLLTSQMANLAASQDIAKLEKQVETEYASFTQLADTISKARRKAALKLSRGVSTHLQSLGMRGAKMEISLVSQNPTSSGCDQIEFQIAGHEGVAPRAIAKVASGGELSRIGLAIAVMAAQANPVPTLIFDEADAGIGGSVAEVVGNLMRDLGESRQVLSVTHLPQVAARAHHQFKVTKENVKGPGKSFTSKTLSKVQLLEESARTDEIARMLGGIEITSTTRQHASELLRQPSST
jgi:DNA repair protein RecN (Recombination protein N)